MTITFIICFSLVVIACIICYTVYKTSNNSRLEDCYRTIESYQKSNSQIFETFHRYRDEMIEFKIEMRKCSDLVKSLCLKTDEESHEE